MKTVSAIAIVAALSLSAAGAAEAKGCLKGAVVGGVAGHVVGHHAVLGAAAGCVVGHHIAHKKEVEQRRAVQAQQQAAAHR